MKKTSFLEKHRLKRHEIKKDILYFGLPAIFVFSSGLVVSVFDGSLKSMLDQVEQSPGLLVLPPLSLVGVGLFILGFSIMIVAQITLWKNYSATLVIREDHKLITQGIYKFCRHPIYLGVLIVASGISMFCTSVIGFLILLFLIPVFHVRIRMEENLLIEEFGDRYLAYQKRTRIWTPFF